MSMENYLKHCETRNISRAETMTEMFRRSNLRFLEGCAKEFGFEITCVQDMEAQTEANLRKSNKCKKCGLQCKGYEHLERHRDNLDCVRRQRINAAELSNQEYVPDHKKKKWCDICKVSYHRYFPHEKTTKHKDAVESFLGQKFELKCQLCEKEFPTKSKMTRHLKESKKCHRKVDDADQYLKWDCMCKKLHVRWDPKLVVKKV
jgi:hypothetical protein